VKIMPLTEKWVITIRRKMGVQEIVYFGCAKSRERNKRTLNDLTNQLIEGLKLHPEIGSTKIEFNMQDGRTNI
jgi:hypothetical protein